MPVCFVTWRHQVEEEALCQQHLPRAQDTAPAAVRGQRAACQRRETPSVRQPQERRKGVTEVLPLL